VYGIFIQQILASPLHSHVFEKIYGHKDDTECEI